MNYENLKPVDHSKEELELINKLFAENYRGITYLVKSKVKGTIFVEDLVSEIFCKASQNIRLYDENSAKINTWLYTLAANHIIDYFRANKNKSSCDNITDLECNSETEFQIRTPEKSSADAILLNAEKEEKLKIAFDSLSEKYIDIANFYFIHDYSYNEICSVLNLPLGTVKAMLFRIRGKLQESLKQAKKVAQTA